MITINLLIFMAGFIIALALMLVMHILVSRRNNEMNFEMEKEIIYLKKEIQRVVSSRGLCASAQELARFLEVMPFNENNLNAKKLEMLDRLKRFIKGDELDKWPCAQHDILCCIAKALCPKTQIPKYNLFSRSDLLHFDPAKNGHNILKHNISFLDVVHCSGDSFGRLITPNGNGRYVYFSYFFKDNERKYVISVCELPKNRNEKFDPEVRKLIEDILNNDLCKENPRTLVNEILSSLERKTQEGVLDKGKICPQPRMITARFFSKENLDKTIRNVIRDNKLNKETIDALRKRAKEILEKDFII